MNEEYEIVANDEPSLEDYPPLALVPDLEGEALAYEEALALHDEEDEEEEEQAQEHARPNRRMIRAAKRAARKHGAGWTRAFRYGRESKPW